MPKGSHRYSGSCRRPALRRTDRRAREALPVRMNTLLVGPFLFLQAADPQPPSAIRECATPDAIGGKADMARTCQHVR